MLGPDDVGHRVVIRRRAGEKYFSDVLGHLVDLTESEVTIRTRHQTVRVPTTEITHAKRVPDRRRPTATEALERVAAAGWPAPEQEHLGEWLLRAAGGWTARGNSALPIGDPGCTLAEAVDGVERWYQARDLPPKISIADPVGGRLTAEVARRGYTAAPPTLVQTAPLAAAENHPGVRLDAAPNEEWFAAVAGHKGALPDVARRILTGVPVARYAGVYAADGSALAVGRGVVTGGWLGVSLVSVDPAHRRRGLARAVVEALAAWAVDAGAGRAYLQVEKHNTAAVAMYERLGFTTHHRYVTWAAP